MTGASRRGPVTGCRPGPGGGGRQICQCAAKGLVTPLAAYHYDVCLLLEDLVQSCARGVPAPRQ